MYDGAIILENNLFVSAQSGEKIIVSAAGYTINEEVYPAGTVIKAGDRKYIILGDTTDETETLSTSNFTGVALDKAGNATITTVEGVARFSENKILTLENGSTFNLGLEALTLSDGTTVNLTEIGGTTSDFVALNSNQNPGSAGSDNQAAGDGAGGNGTGGNANSGAAGNNGAASSGSASGGENFNITEDMYKGLFVKQTPSGYVVGVTSITPISAMININYSDPSNALVSNPTVIVLDQVGQEVYRSIVRGSTVSVTGLQPNTRYTIELIGSFDLGTGVETKQLDSSAFNSGTVEAKLGIKIMRKDSVDINVMILDNLMLDEASVIVEQRAGTD